MSKQCSITAARNSLTSLVHEVETGPPVELTRRGRPVAVLLSVSEYRKLRADRPDLWSSIQRFRQETDLRELDVEAVYSGVRDRSPGREPDL